MTNYTPAGSMGTLRLESDKCRPQKMPTWDNITPRTEIKLSGNGKCFHPWLETASAAMTTHRTSKSARVCICRRKVRTNWARGQSKSFVTCLWKVGLKKKSLYKRHMCSLSGVITGPPRFSFRFQMSSDMFRLAHLCSVSPELLAFYWQILGSLNLCTIDALKSANILFQSNSPWVKKFPPFTLLVISQKVQAGNSYRREKLNSTYPKYSVQALEGISLFL